MRVEGKGVVFGLGAALLSLTVLGIVGHRLSGSSNSNGAANRSMDREVNGSNKEVAAAYAGLSPQAEDQPSLAKRQSNSSPRVEEVGSEESDGDSSESSSGCEMSESEDESGSSSSSNEDEGDDDHSTDDDDNDNEDEGHEGDEWSKSNAIGRAVVPDGTPASSSILRKRKSRTDFTSDDREVVKLPEYKGSFLGRFWRTISGRGSREAAVKKMFVPAESMEEDIDDPYRPYRQARSRL